MNTHSSRSVGILFAAGILIAVATPGVATASGTATHSRAQVASLIAKDNQPGAAALPGDVRALKAVTPAPLPGDVPVGARAASLPYSQRAYENHYLSPVPPAAGPSPVDPAAPLPGDIRVRELAPGGGDTPPQTAVQPITVDDNAIEYLQIGLGFLVGLAGALVVAIVMTNRRGRAMTA